MTKKIVKRKKKEQSVDITTLSIADLYALYLFVSNDGNNRGFGMTSPAAREVVRSRQKEIEQELYKRAYGYDPFAEHKLEIEGMKPEDIDLDRVAVYKHESDDETKVTMEEDEKPETFVVVKNKTEEE